MVLSLSERSHIGSYLMSTVDVTELPDSGFGKKWLCWQRDSERCYVTHQVLTSRVAVSCNSVRMKMILQEISLVNSFYCGARRDSVCE
jgi:hypothetical protein